MSSDARPLPAGWTVHRDERTGSLFYVNHNAQPATMSWTHPLDPALQAAPVKHQVAAPSPPGQVAHSIEYAPRPASRTTYTPSPQPSTHSGTSSGDRAPPPGTVRELHTVATPPVPARHGVASPPPGAGVHSRSVSMSYVGQGQQQQQQYVPPQQLQQQFAPPQQLQQQQFVPQEQQNQQYVPPPPPRLASNPNRMSSYTPRLPVIPPQQPVQQQPVQQQQPSRVSALYVAQAGVQGPTRSSKFSSFFGTAKTKPFQQQIMPLQQAPARPPSTIYQRPLQQPILTQQFTGMQQQQFVPQQFVGQQQQQLVQQQVQQVLPQHLQAVPQQLQQQVQQVGVAQQFVPAQQQQLAPQQFQALQHHPLPPVPQQPAVAVPQQQQPAVGAAPQAPIDPQVLLQLSALLAQQQGVDQAQILAQLLVAQQQLQPQPIQQQQVAPANGSIPVTAPQPVHAIPAQLTLGLSPSPSPQSPQSSLAHAAYAPGLGLYTSSQQSPQTSPQAVIGSPPQAETTSPVVPTSGIPSFDATFPVDATPAVAAVPEASQSTSNQGPESENGPGAQVLQTQTQEDSFPAATAALPTPEYTPNPSDSEHAEGNNNSPGQLPAYSLEPPSDVLAADSFSAEVLDAMAHAAAENPAPASPPVVVQAAVEVPAAPTPPQGAPVAYTPAVQLVRPALPPRPSGPRPNVASSHGVASHTAPSHLPAAYAQAVPSAGVHQPSPGQVPQMVHAASPPPTVSPTHSVQFTPPPQGIPGHQYAPAAALSVGQTPGLAQAQIPARPTQQPQQVPVYAQAQPAPQSPVYVHQQQQYAQQQQQHSAPQAQQAPVHAQQAQQQQQQQQQSSSPPPPPPKPSYAVYPDPGRQQSIGDRLSSFMSNPTTQSIAAKGAGILGNLFVRTAVNAVTDSDTDGNYGYNTGPSGTAIAANLVQNAIQQSIAPPQAGLAGTANATQAQLLQAQIQANAQAQTNALLQNMQGAQGQQAQVTAALLQAQKIQAANAQASFQAAQQQQQQQNTQAQIAALLKMQQQQAANQQAQQQNVLQQIQQQQQAALQQAQEQAANQQTQQQNVLQQIQQQQQAQQQAALQQIQQQAANQQAQQQAMLQQVQQQQEAAQQAALEQVQQQTAFYQAQQQAALEQLQAQNNVAFTPQIFASMGTEQPNNYSGTDTLAQTIAQMAQQGGTSDPYGQAFAPDASVVQESSTDFLAAMSQAILNGAQSGGGYDPSAYLGDQQPGADASALQAMTDALSQMQMGSEQLMSGGYDATQQTDYSQYLSSFDASGSILDNAVSNSI